MSALRTAFTVNTSLRRLFLSDTGLTTEGAIALAEFLPESRTLLHVDLTSNPLIEAAGVMAISVGLKSNSTIRCLDLSIPPDNPELAEISQRILQSCIRNTELAASHVENGRTETIWGPIKRSALVKDVKRAEDVRADAERLEQAISPEGIAREYVYTLKPSELVPTSEATARDLEKWFEAGKAHRTGGFDGWQPGQLPAEDFSPLLERVKALRERLVEVIQNTTNDELEKLLAVNDQLGSLVDRSKGFRSPLRLLLPSQVISAPTAKSAGLSAHHASSAGNASRSSASTRRHLRVSSLEISSPNFSIGDSDNDSDAEELDVGSLPRSTSATSTPMAIRKNPPSLKATSAESAGASGQTGETLDVLGLSADSVEVGVEASSPKAEGITSPVERASRAWLEEEGEIFRKGSKLGVVDDEDEENEASGEVLKQEVRTIPLADLLCAPHRQVKDEIRKLIIWCRSSIQRSCVVLRGA